MECFELANGVFLPKIGFGTFQLTDAKTCEQCVGYALETGYRLIDTAASYHNEKAVGNAIRHAGIPRSELFLTTKLWIQDTGYDRTLHAFEQSLKKLGVDYLGLYLIHQPFGDVYDSWRAMERLYREGAVKAIGVSNFSSERLIDLCMNQDIKPMVNQIEIHPFFQQGDAIKVMKEHHVLPQAWGPLSEAQRDIFHHKILMKIAAKHGVSTAQVMLRWHYQRGVATIPKTAHGERMKENLDIFDFALSEKDMNAISTMDIGHSEIMDHRSPCTARQLNSIKIHA